MSRLKRLARHLEPFAIPHLTLGLVAGQAFVYLAMLLGQLDPGKLWLVPGLVLQGEVWRLLTFVFLPPPAHWALIAFALYFLYLTGNTLEEYWGTFRYNLFLLTGYVLTVGFAFVTPGFIATNVFIGGSIFLAFAYIQPDFVLYIFFVLPVKVKWLALFIWAGYLWAFFTGGLAAKLSVVAGVGNYLIFFGRDLWLDARAGRRRMQTQARRAAEQAEAAPRHRCRVCGRDSNTHPALDFRYCSRCAGDQCYCPEHIGAHEHVRIADEQAKA